MNGESSTVTLKSTNGKPAVPTPAQAFRPRVDVRETQQELLIVADLPGATAESIDVQCENGVLTVTAKVEPRQTVARGWLLREYGVGDFQRSFQLDERIDTGRITGEYAQGVLTLRLPKSEAARPRKVLIKSA